MTAAMTIQLSGPLVDVKLSNRQGQSVQSSQTQLQQAQQPQPLPTSDASELMKKAQAQQDAQIARQLSQVMAALNEAAADLQEMQKRLMQDAEQQLLDLAFKIAGKILNQEIQAGRYEIDPIVRQAISGISTNQEIVVYLNPLDLARCKIVQDEGESLGYLKFAADPSVEPAHCRVQTQSGTLTGGIDSQMEDLAEALKSLSE